MRKLTATFCLTIALMLGSVGVSWSAGKQEVKQNWLKSQKYFLQGKSIEADFYLALYLHREVADPRRQIPNLFKKLDLRKIPNLYFIDGAYSDEFLGDFFGESLFQWDTNLIDHKNLVIATKLKEDKNSNLYALVWGQPELSRWYVMNKQGSKNSYLLGLRTAYVDVGGYNAEKNPIPCASIKISGPLTTVYKPKFVDLDDDGVPELLLKYNQAVADGYVQVLKIYKSSNGKNLCKNELIKEFSARNGFIINSEKVFKVGKQKRANDKESWLGASTHEVKEYFYDVKTYKIKNTKIIGNVLRGNNREFWR